MGNRIFNTWIFPVSMTLDAVYPTINFRLVLLIGSEAFPDMEKKIGVK
jgi:hypothetical protein